MAVYAAGQIVNASELNTGTAQIDLTTFTVSTTGAFVQASKLWDIPANSATGGSSWRLTVLGSFHIGATAVGNNWYIGWGPSGATQTEIAQASSVNYSINTTNYFVVTIYLVVGFGGSSGVASAIGYVGTGDTGSNVFEWTNGSLQASFNTTVDNGLMFIYDWAAITSGPTLTSVLSIFERMS